MDILRKKEANSEVELSMIKEGKLSKHKEVNSMERTFVNVDEIFEEVHRQEEEAAKQHARYRDLVRDMLAEIAERVIMMTEIYDPDITLAVVMGLYAGLRVGEVCNLRMESSTYGPCFRFTLASKDCCTGIKIDLTRELPLRSDGIAVGGIKSERVQEVYSGYAQVIYDYYQKHIQRTKDYPREEAMPLFVSTRKVDGRCMAMTRTEYTARARKIFCDHVLPSCKDDPDPNMRLFYQQMKGRAWGVRFLRQWYTVSLALSGVDNFASLMCLRGDRSPYSAMVYIQNVGEIERRYLEAYEECERMIKEEV